MIDRNALTVTSRERLRLEIAQQTELFLRAGGCIDRLQNMHAVTRPIGPVWWDARGSGPLLNS